MKTHMPGYGFLNCGSPARRLAALLMVNICALILATNVVAQSKPINQDAAVILARTVVIAVNQANQTGNYAVLRDLGSPAFANANTPARLAVLFARLRERRLDMSPVVLFDPTFTRGPVIDKNGRLRMTGFFPTSPVRVNFDMLFDKIGRSWRIFGLLVNITNEPIPLDTPSGTGKQDSLQVAPPDTPVTTID